MDKKKKIILLKFIKFVKEKLDIDGFTIKMSEDRTGFVTFAYYNPETKEVAVYIKDRALPDLLRSYCHELQHHRDNLRGKLTGNNPDIGKINDDNTIDADDVENKANSVAGSLLKSFAFSLKEKEGIDIYDL